MKKHILTRGIALLLAFAMITGQVMVASALGGDIVIDPNGSDTVIDTEAGNTQTPDSTMPTPLPEADQSTATPSMTPGDVVLDPDATATPEIAATPNLSTSTDVTETPDPNDPALVDTESTPDPEGGISVKIYADRETVNEGEKCVFTVVVKDSDLNNEPNIKENDVLTLDLPDFLTVEDVQEALRHDWASYFKAASYDEDDHVLKLTFKQPTIIGEDSAAQVAMEFQITTVTDLTGYDGNDNGDITVGIGSTDSDRVQISIGDGVGEPGTDTYLNKTVFGNYLEKDDTNHSYVLNDPTKPITYSIPFGCSSGYDDKITLTDNLSNGNLSLCDSSGNLDAALSRCVRLKVNGSDLSPSSASSDRLTYTGTALGTITLSLSGGKLVLVCEHPEGYDPEENPAVQVGVTLRYYAILTGNADNVQNNVTLNVDDDVTMSDSATVRRTRSASLLATKKALKDGKEVTIIDVTNGMPDDVTLTFRIVLVQYGTGNSLKDGDEVVYDILENCFTFVEGSQKFSVGAEDIFELEHEGQKLTIIKKGDDSILAGTYYIDFDVQVALEGENALLPGQTATNTVGTTVVIRRDAKLVIDKAWANDEKIGGGSVFELKNDRDKVIAAATSTADGKLTMYLNADDLSTGTQTYQLVETVSEDSGHNSVPDIPVVIRKSDDGITIVSVNGIDCCSGDVEVDIENKEDSGLGSLQFKKYANSASSEENLLAGGVFHLYYKAPDAEDFTLYREAFSTTDGTVLFDKIPYGEYYVKELSAPAGYVIVSEESQHVTLKKTNAHGTISMVNETYEDGEITVKKVDQDGKALEGVTFTLNPGEKAAVTDESGTATFDGLTAGIYVIQETLPVGYTGFAGPITVTIDEKGTAKEIDAVAGVTAVGNAITIHWSNIKVYGSLRVLKYGKDSALLKGAVFELSGNGIEKKTVETGANGVASFTGLPFGTYTLKEIAAPAGYVLSTELSNGISVTIDATTEKQIAFTNTTEKGSIELTKVGSGNAALEGAVFGLYADRAASNLLKALASGKDGKVTFTGLEAGTYYVKEIVAPTGYQLDTTVHTFIVGEEDQPTETAWTHTKQIVNELKEYKLKLVKKGDAGEVLAGAVFTISGSGIEDQTVTTDAQGEAVFTNLPYGTYMIRETTAPAGYVVAADVRVTINDSVTNAAYTEGQFANVPVEVINAHTQLTVSKVDDKSPNDMLAGASFKIKSGSSYIFAEQRGDVYYFTGADAEGSTFVTGSDGKFRVEYLPLGSYTLVETAAPDGYIIAKEETGFRIASAKESLTVGNTMIRTKLRLTKMDTYGKLLADVGFTMRTAAGYVAATGNRGSYTYSGLTDAANATVFMTDANGVFTIDKIVMGTYYLDETVYPEGLKPQSGIQIDVTEETHGTTIEKTVINEMQYGEISFVKKSSLGGALAGAMFKLELVHGSDYAATSKPYYALSDADGIVEFKEIPFGIYKLTEYLAPAGYVLSEEVRYLAIGDVEVPDHIELTDLPEKDWINDTIVKPFSVKKVSAADGQALSGAVFRILDADRNSLGDAYLLTVNEGISNEVILPLGNYYLDEIAAPANYILDDALIPFEVRADVENTVTVKNVPYTGALFIEKVDAEDDTVKLTGAEFAVFAREDYNTNGLNAETLYTLVTNSKGTASIDGIPCGDYVLVETFAPYGYRLDQAPRYFTISAESEETLQASVVVENHATKYMLRILKVDQADENIVLEGAVFSVSGYDFYREVTTGPQGYVDVEVPAPGMYMIRELVPPIGYTLDPEAHGLLVSEPMVMRAAPTAVFISRNFKTRVLLEKVDEEGKLLDGAVFALYALIDGEEQPVRLSKGDDGVYTYDVLGEPTEIEVGSAEIVRLPVGNYFFRELKAPDRYTNLGDIRFTLNADRYDKALSVTAENFLHRKGVAVYKQDANGIRLAGAEFGLYAVGSDEPMETQITSASGYAVFTDLLSGSYVIREISAPVGFQPIDMEYTFTIEGDGSFMSAQPYQSIGTDEDPIFVFTVVNEPVSHSFRIRKVSAANPSKVLEGAEFRVIGNGIDRIYKTDATGSTGDILLPIGEYTVAECKAPSGYIMSIDAHHIEIAPDGVYADGKKLESDVAFTVENTPESFRLRLIKQDAKTGEPLSNAAFVVTGENGAKYAMVTDANGVAAPVTLQPGTYAISETVAPNGYQLPLKGWSFTVEAGSELRVTAVNGAPFIFEDGLLTMTLSNERTTGNLRILKYDSEDSAPLAGAVFTVKDSKDEILHFAKENGIYTVAASGETTVTTGMDGTLLLQGLVFGTYIVEEVEAPVGYEIRTDANLIKLTEQNETVTLRVANEKLYRKVTVLKQSAGENPENLMGAVFALYTADGVFIEEAVSGSDGKVTFTVPFGSYIIIETKAPEGYELYAGEPFAFTYDENTKEDEVFTYTFVNEKSVYALEIQKVDASDETLLLEGAEFAVTDSRQFTQIVTTGTDGKARIDNLVYDDYIIREVKAPKGYIPSEEVYTIAKEDLFHNNAVTIKVPNVYIQGSVSLCKIDHDDPETTLEGAEFIIKDAEGTTLHWTVEGSVYTLSAEGTETITAGHVTLDALPEGQYTLIETKAPEGYVIVEAERTFSITAEDHEQTIAIEIENLLRRMTVGIIKIDHENRDLRLEGAEFTLYRRAGSVETPVAQAVTNSNGIATFTELPMGSYRIRETKAPYGYKLWSNPIDFIVDGDGNVKVGGNGILLPLVDNMCMASVTNTALTKEITIKKISDRGDVLAGAKFRITGNGKTYDVTTGEDGTAKLTLRYGDYVLEEIVAPDGYVLSEEEITFKIDDAGLTVGTEVVEELIISVVNNPVIYCFQIHKRDAESGKDLSGAVFTITDGTDSVSVTTDSRGIASPIKLRPGTYAVTEMTPPAGYPKPLTGWTLVIKNDGSMEITGENATVAVDCSGRIVTIGNKLPKPTPTPGITKTGQADTMPMLIGGSLLMLFSLVGFIFLAVLQRKRDLMGI